MVMLSAARKQWLKLSRIIQKQRASTLNADKILKYTHTIAHMQHMRFSTRPPMDDPEADVYFLTSHQLGIMPLQCFTIYVTASIEEQEFADTLSQLPADSLIVDYGQTAAWQDMGLQPKHVLEEQVASEWQHAERFLDSHHINLRQLLDDPSRTIDTMDTALDTLLGTSQKFLQVACDFQRALELARPLRISRDTRRQYDAFSLLGHRVQALMPGAFTQHFLEIYNEDDGFFLYDENKLRNLVDTGESLGETLARHTHAGRSNLALAAAARAQLRRRSFFCLNGPPTTHQDISSTSIWNYNFFTVMFLQPLTDRTGMPAKYVNQTFQPLALNK